MKVVMINGSPKAKNGNSGYLLELLRRRLPAGWEYNEYQVIKSKDYDAALAQALYCDLLVFSFPLYVDSLPSHVLCLLKDLEKAFTNMTPVKPLKVYAMINCGFFEGHQNHVAAEIMQNWAVKAGLPWGQALMTGGGEMLGETKAVPMGRGPNKNIDRALKILSANIMQGYSAESVCINPSFPRFLFIFMANRMWGFMLRKNGFKGKAVYAR